MGQKKKTGKSRQDKFYKLAKESGFRARSAFKLIQLNRKFEFLQSSKVVIDLCAAPGGWLQVAVQNTPVSSVILGVDLVPIKAIPRVTTIIGDITSDKCRKDLKKELQTWKADCVLNDGAPNVGKNWVHDAFQQNQLTLQAIKLATEFLRKGGWFVTKVFRSKDYNALLWVLHQLFKNVHATKPQASRNESAEIFVVCQNFLAPDRIDPKFLDPKFVFKEVGEEPKMKINLMHPEKFTRHRDGYPTGDYTLYHTLNVSDLVNKENYQELLSNANAVIFDDKDIENHPLTTDEIKECLKDIRLLGRKDIKKIITWRKKLINQMGLGEKKEDEEKKEAEEEEENSENELAKLEEKVAELKGEEKKTLKRKIKKTRREKAKLQHKMDMKMVIASDNLESNEDVSLFNLNKIKSRNQLSKVVEDDINYSDASEESEDEAPRKQTKLYDKNSKGHLLDDDDDDDMVDASDESDDGENYTNGDAFNDEIEWESDEDINGRGDDIEEDDESNPLLVGRPGRNAQTDMWFSKESFAGLETEMDEDIELDKMVEVYQKKGGVVKGVNDKSNEKTAHESVPKSKGKEMETAQQEESGQNKPDMSDNDSDRYSDSDSDADSYSESDEEGDDKDTTEFYKEQKESLKQKKQGKTTGEGDFEVVPAMEPVRMSAKSLAIGAAIVSSRKRRREIIDSGYNRYMMFGEENLPDWFARDEILHQRVQIPVTKGEIDEYKMKMKAIDANPIKKVAEAKLRKKRKMAKKLDRVRKKADTINDNVEVTDREKWQQIKQVYKKAGLLSSKKKDVKYVVCGRAQAGKRVARPKGVSGPYRVVDKRLKKDKKAQARASKGKKGKGKKGK